MSSVINPCRGVLKVCANGCYRVIQRRNKELLTNNLLCQALNRTQGLSNVVEDKSRFSEDSDEVPEAERFIHKSEVERFMIDSMQKVGAEEHRCKMLAANLSEAD